MIFESKIEDNALWNPLSTAVFTDNPFFNSSLILSNISTLASTAIPTVSKNAAIPGNVSATPFSANIKSTNVVYKVNAIEAIIPGTL